MKRFYRAATARPSEDGWLIALDERPVRTPGKEILLAPTEALGKAIAQEWNDQQERIDPRSMPMTGLANAAIDRVAPDPEGFAARLAAYGASDLVCYRADRPANLAARQAETWDPLLAWARRRFDAELEVVEGIMPHAQPEASLQRLAQAVSALDPFAMAALSPLVTISGSLIIALALAEDEIDLDAAWSAATIDEAFQAEHWGEDEEAAAALAARRREFEAGRRFLDLLRRR